MRSDLNWKQGVLIGLVLVGLVIPWLMDRVPQDPTYHHFADTTQWLGIPNCFNVITNALFVLVGVVGIMASRSKGFVLDLVEMRRFYHVFCVGVILVGVGSAYYHVNPNNSTLVWDRFPMTISFMALFALILADGVSIRAGKVLFWPLIGIGLGSVGYWYVTELWGAGDLRPYGMVQFLPMALIPVILVLFGARTMRGLFLWFAVGIYLLAKICELFDAEIFSLTGIVSGHSLKHVFAAIATACVIAACQRTSYLNR